MPLYKTSTRTTHGAFAVGALALAVAMALAAPQAARASAFQLNENSAQAMGRAYAGDGAAPGDPSVVVNNPASMAWFKHSYLQVSATAIDFSSHFHGSATDALGQPISGGDGGNAGGTIPVPALFYLRPINDQWAFGMGVSAPFGFQTQYNPTWVGRYNAILSDFKSVDATFSVSYKVADNFALGASLIAQRTSADLTSAINFGSILAAPPFNLAPTFMPQSADGLAQIKGHNRKWGWQIGATWKPTERDTIVVLYHAKISQTLTGNATFIVPAQVQTVFAAAQLPLFQNTGGSAAFATPAYVNLSYWHVFNKRFSAGVQANWTQWSSFKNLTVVYANPAQPPSTEVFNWHNSHFISVGGAYHLSDTLTLRAGVGLDTTPTYQLTRDPRVPDATRRWLTFGVGYRPVDNFEINVGYAHLFVNNARINNVSPTGDLLTGYYNNSADLLSASATYRF